MEWLFDLFSNIQWLSDDAIASGVIWLYFMIGFAGLCIITAIVEFMSDKIACASERRRKKKGRNNYWR